MLVLERIATNSTIPLEAECICPDRLRNLSVAAVEQLEVQHGNRVEPLSEHFRVRGEPCEQVTLEGDCSTVKWVGAGMTLGSIEIKGSIGMHVGAEMAGGTIRVQGDAGDWVGAEMSGGLIHVLGNAGHLIGSAYRGGKYGMRGGEILIEGNVGNEVGGQMRRGLIAIGGDCGDFVGVSMIAGTILGLGRVGLRAGAGMKRGTIALLALGNETAILPTFRRGGCFDANFLTLYRRRLRCLGFGHEKLRTAAEPMQRFSGDMLELGKGEILLPNHF